MNSISRKAWPIFFVLTVAFFIPAHIAAQADSVQIRRLTGKLVDEETGKPVPDAVVSISEMNSNVTSTPDGMFYIEIPAEAETLTITKPGYDKKIVTVNTDTETDFIEIELQSSSITELQKITVTTHRNSLKSNENVSQLTISPELVSNLPAVGQTDVFRTLQLLPGISGTNESSSALFVRGGTPDQNLVYLDGMPIYYVDHFYGFYSAFNPSAINDVSIHKGGFGPQWGGRLSSVVKLSSVGKKKPYHSDGIGGEAAIGTGTLSSSAYLQLPVINHDIGTIMFAIRRSTIDFFQNGLFDKLFDRMHGPDTTKYVTYNPGFYSFNTGDGGSIVYEPTFSFLDINGLVSFRPGSRSTLTTSFFMSQDNQDNSLDTSYIASRVNRLSSNQTTFASSALAYDTITATTFIKDKSVSSWGNLCIGEEWEQLWSDRFTSNLSLSYSSFTDKQNNDYDRSQNVSHRYSDGTPEVQTDTGFTSWVKTTNKIADLSVRFDNVLKLSDMHTLSAGVEASHKSVIYEKDTLIDTSDIQWHSMPPYYQQLLGPLNCRDTGLSLAMYLGDDISFNEKAGLSLGGRAYYFTLASTFAFDPRISGWWKPIPDLKVKAAWGMYTQEIHRAEKENIVGGSNFVWLLATKERPLEKSQQYIGGISWEKTHLLLDVEAYYKKLNGLLTISERPALTWQQQQQFNPDNLLLYEGTGIAKGIEFLAQIKDVSPPFLSGNLTYNGWLSYTLSKVEHTYDVFNDDNPFPASQDRPHEIKLVNNLRWDMAKWSSINIGAIWLYSTGTPYTAPLGEYTIMMMDSLMRLNLSHVSDKNEYRLPDYHRLDLSATWKVNIGKHLTGKLSLGFFNVYNHENILERTYLKHTTQQTATSSSTTYYTALEKRSIMFQFHPALTVQATF